MDFGAALEKLKKGLQVSRTGWNGAGLWLQLQRPDEGSKMTLPYIYISYPADAKTSPGAKCPWLASQTDLLAEDWELVVRSDVPRPAPRANPLNSDEILAFRQLVCRLDRFRQDTIMRGFDAQKGDAIDEYCRKIIRDFNSPGAF